MERSIQRGEKFSFSDDLFEIAAASVGEPQAFDWLVRSHAQEHGWQHYWQDVERVKPRWQIVKDRYRERWLEFMIKSIELEDRDRRAPCGKEKIERMVQFCIFMEEVGLAEALTETVTQFVSEIVSPLDLKLPEWVPEHV